MNQIKRRFFAAPVRINLHDQLTKVIWAIVRKIFNKDLSPRGDLTQLLKSNY